MFDIPLDFCLRDYIWAYVDSGYGATHVSVYDGRVSGYNGRVSVYDGRVSVYDGRISVHSGPPQTETPNGAPGQT